MQKYWHTKIDLVFFRLNGILWNWYVPNAVVNAVSAWDSLLTGMLWNAWAASSDEKYLAPARSINTSPMQGTGKQSAMVTVFRALKSSAHLFPCPS